MGSAIYIFIVSTISSLFELSSFRVIELFFFYFFFLISILISYIIKYYKYVFNYYKYILYSSHVIITLVYIIRFKELFN